MCMAKIKVQYIDFKMDESFGEKAHNTLEWI